MNLPEAVWLFESGRPGPHVVLSFGVHGNERPPIDAGLALLERLGTGDLPLRAGRVLLVHANPRASAEDQRWSDGGIDLNRCFHRDVLAREPQNYEERRAREIVACLEEFEAETLVDFHCTVEPGRRFLMHHPPVSEPRHRATVGWLEGEVVLCDPDLNFGSVSLDEWMSTRDRVGICYETGWIQDPANTAEACLGEMTNLLAGLGVIEGEARAFTEKLCVELDRVLLCEGEGFAWSEGTGENLQHLEAGTLLGRYGDGTEVTLGAEAVLIFPKKKPELVQLGKPLVYLSTPKP